VPVPSTKSTAPERTTLFDLNAAVGFVLNVGNNRFDRAIMVYEMMVVMHLCRGTPEPFDPGPPSAVTNLVVNVAADDLKTARHFAVIRLLEHIQRTSPPLGKKKLSDSQILTAALDRDYRHLFDDVFLTNGGWRRTRYLPAVREFEKRLKESGANHIGHVIDFSLHFSRNPQKPRHRGGLTMAREIILRSPYFCIPARKTWFSEKWSLLRPVAAFDYLIYLQKLGMSPIGLTKRDFATRLLNRAKRRRRLLNFFLAYNEVCDRLSDRGYGYEKLKLEGSLPDGKLIISPYPTEVQQLINDYHGQE
jgi:hypothetical protein